MKKSKVNNDPNTMLIQRKYKQRAKNTNKKKNQKKPLKKNLFKKNITPQLNI